MAPLVSLTAGSTRSEDCSPSSSIALASVGKAHFSLEIILLFSWMSRRGQQVIQERPLPYVA